MGNSEYGTQSKEVGGWIDRSFLFLCLSAKSNQKRGRSNLLLGQPRDHEVVDEEEADEHGMPQPPTLTPATPTLSQERAVKPSCGG